MGTRIPGTGVNYCYYLDQYDKLRRAQADSDLTPLPADALPGASMTAPARILRYLGKKGMVRELRECRKRYLRLEARQAQSRLYPRQDAGRQDRRQEDRQGR